MRPIVPNKGFVTMLPAPPPEPEEEKKSVDKTFKLKVFGREFSLTLQIIKKE